MLNVSLQFRSTGAYIYIATSNAAAPEAVMAASVWRREFTKLGKVSKFPFCAGSRRLTVKFLRLARRGWTPIAVLEPWSGLFDSH